MDWASIFIHGTTWSFAAEIAIRVTIMFSMIILSLGSIAGDPMFTEDLPLIQALLIMSIIISPYRLCTWLMMKYQPFEKFLEGKLLYIVEDGLLVLEKIKKGEMSHDEFFAEMRQ